MREPGPVAHLDDTSARRATRRSAAAPLFAALAHVRGMRTQYLEFGVYEGNSLRWWAEHLTDPSARFVGFDSFEGLPEDWRHDIRQGQFRTAGPPAIEDPRVSFVVGWFDCHHELRAFVESLAKSGRRVSPLGFHRWHWLFRYE